METRPQTQQTGCAMWLEATKNGFSMQNGHTVDKSKSSLYLFKELYKLYEFVYMQNIQTYRL